MLGVLRRADLRDKRGAREGDRILLTKAVAVEGTALLATELGERLLALGMSEPELARCRAFAERLSVVPEARIAAGFAGVRAMHDVTEGGLATAARRARRRLRAARSPSIATPSPSTPRPRASATCSTPTRSA